MVHLTLVIMQRAPHYLFFARSWLPKHFGRTVVGSEIRDHLSGESSRGSSASAVS